MLRTLFLFKPTNTCDLFRGVPGGEDEAREGGGDHASGPAPNEKKRRQPSGNVDLFGHPGETRTKLPRHKEACTIKIISNLFEYIFRYGAKFLSVFFFETSQI